jgi:hypothetical protein
MRLSSTMPFELTFARGGVWSAGWVAEGVRIAVAGSHDAPHPALAATLRDLVERWAEVRRAIEAFAAAMPPDDRVPLQPPLDGAFRAHDCGFDGRLRYETIAVTAPDAPSRATVTFYTGEPDGYATFEVVLDAGHPLAISAFAS